MQTIVQNLRADGPVGTPVEPVSIVVGMVATLSVRCVDAAGEPAPPTGLDNVASWRFVMAADWDEDTVPCYLTDSVTYDAATATWTVPLDGTRTAQALAALGTEGRIDMGCEIVGLTSSGEWDRPAYVLQWTAAFLNRRDSAGTPTPVDPQPVAPHASTHAADGTDPVTPASIGAATVQDIVERIAPSFVLNAYYAEGSLVSSSTDGTVYRCLHTHVADSWYAVYWTSATVEDVLAILRGAVAAKYTKPATGIPASDIEAGVIPAAQVNADWDAASGVAAILNKPTIPNPNRLAVEEVSRAYPQDGIVYLNPVKAVYRLADTLDWGTDLPLDIVATGIPEGADYFAFEVEWSVPAGATSISGPLSPDPFDATESYAVDDYCVYDGKIWRCEVAHTGAWDETHFLAMDGYPVSCTWLDGGELPTTDFAGKTIYIAFRLDCTARTLLANVWRVA